MVAMNSREDMIADRVALEVSGSGLPLMEDDEWKALKHQKDDNFQKTERDKVEKRRMIQKRLRRRESSEILKVAKSLLAKREIQDILRLAKSVLSGTDTRTIRGTGWTEQEALKNALAEDEREYGHGEGYGGGSGSLRAVIRKKVIREPKKAKRVTIEKFPIRKGPVEKRFVLERRWGFDRDMPIDRDPKYRERYETQGQVLAAAKELALQYGTELVITLEAFCVGDTKLAIVKPEEAQTGEWMFECDFRS